MVRRKLRRMWRAARRLFTVLLVVCLGYLVQVCVMPYFRVLGITPSVMFPVMAIITVCFGKLSALWIGLFYGLLMESMQANVTLMNLLIYPVTALLTCALFSDKSQQQLEYERGIGKAGRNASPLIRTPACAAVSTAVYETVNVAYIYLRGADITGTNIFRAVVAVVINTALTVALMLPLRKWFGFSNLPEEDAAPKPYVSKA